MRITGGYLRGRSFDGPAGHHVHPMGERIRSALFNALGDIEGLSVLDAFAGSGAISLEAVSRGARVVTAIEKDHYAQDTIQRNLEALDVTASVKLVRANAASWLTRSQETYDIVIADPPYSAIVDSLLALLSERLRPGGTAVLSLPPRYPFRLDPTIYALITSKSYGDAELHFYRRTR